MLNGHIIVVYKCINRLSEWQLASGSNDNTIKTWNPLY